MRRLPNPAPPSRAPAPPFRSAKARFAKAPIVSLASLVVASAIAASSGQPPVTRDDRSYAAIVSLDRVRAALDKPPSKLTLPEKQPDFSVDIRERKHFDQMVLPLLDFKVGPGFPQSALFTSPFGSQPLFTVDLMPVAV